MSVKAHSAAALALRLAVALAAISAAPSSAFSATPIVTDSRIKTFIYNENEVYTVTTHYGYQSNIELGPNEEIQTLSVGDRVGWQIVPAGRRIFIRAMEEAAHTNMTVVTNKRAYQFDIREANQAALAPGEELVYVVRFYYPDEPGFRPPVPVVTAADLAPTPAPLPTPTPAPAPAVAPVPPAQPQAAAPMNYNYTFAGPATIAPVKIFDDGARTYFKLPASAAQPRFAVLTASGQEMQLPASSTPDGLTMVNAVASRFTIRSGTSRVVVYNENQPGA